MTAVKPKQVRLNISADAEQVIDELSKNVPLSETAIASIVLDAGMRAIRDAGFQMSLPLRLAIEQPSKTRK